MASAQQDDPARRKLWLVISYNLDGFGGRGDPEMRVALVDWWRFIRDHVPPGVVHEVKLFRQVLGPNRWHYQTWFQVEGVDSWEKVAGVMGTLPWYKSHPDFPAIRAKVHQIDHQDEYLEEVDLDERGGL